MAYRDEIEAARARIAALEEELEAARAEAVKDEKRRESSSKEAVPVVPTMRERLAKLRAAEQRIVELERKQEDLRRGLAESEARAAGLEEKLAASSSELRSITDHNRRLAPTLTGAPAGVLCPMCLLAGDRVEMLLRSGFPLVREEMGETCACPRCLLLHVLHV